MRAPTFRRVGLNVRDTKVRGVTWPEASAKLRHLGHASRKPNEFADRLRFRVSQPGCSGTYSRCGLCCTTIWWAQCNMQNFLCGCLLYPNHGGTRQSALVVVPRNPSWLTVSSLILLDTAASANPPEGCLAPAALESRCSCVAEVYHVLSKWSCPPASLPRRLLRFSARFVRRLRSVLKGIKRTRSERRNQHNWSSLCGVPTVGKCQLPSIGTCSLELAVDVTMDVKNKVCVLMTLPGNVPR